MVSGTLVENGRDMGITNELFRSSSHRVVVTDMCRLGLVEVSRTPAHAVSVMDTTKPFSSLKSRMIAERREVGLELALATPNAKVWQRWKSRLERELELFALNFCSAPV